MINPEQKALVITMFSEGQSFNVIARKLKLTKGQVAGTIHRHRALHGEAHDGIGIPLRADAHQHDDSLPSIRIRK